MWYHNGAYEEEDSKYKIDKEYYVKFDKMIAVSEDCKKNLLEKFPQLQSKILILHNIINRHEIIKLSQKAQDDIFDKNTINIVSVGRLTKEKGGSLAVDICKSLSDEGYNIRWLSLIHI